MLFCFFFGWNCIFVGSFCWISLKELKHNLQLKLRKPCLKQTTPEEIFFHTKNSQVSCVFHTHVRKRAVFVALKPFPRPTQCLQSAQRLTAHADGKFGNNQIPLQQLFIFVVNSGEVALS